MTCKDGRVLKAERSHGKGSAADPLSRDEVVEKFHRLASVRLGQAADELYSQVMSLEKTSAASLRALLRVAA